MTDKISRRHGLRPFAVKFTMPAGVQPQCWSTCGCSCAFKGSTRSRAQQHLASLARRKRRVHGIGNAVQAEDPFDRQLHGPLRD